MPNIKEIPITVQLPTLEKSESDTISFLSDEDHEKVKNKLIKAGGE